MFEIKLLISDEGLLAESTFSGRRGKRGTNFASLCGRRE